MENVSILTAIDQIKFFEWSSDSTLILAGMPSRNKVQIFNISDPKWSCMIDAGVLGVDWARVVKLRIRAYPRKLKTKMNFFGKSQNLKEKSKFTKFLESLKI